MKATIEEFQGRALPELIPPPAHRQRPSAVAEQGKSMWLSGDGGGDVFLLRRKAPVCDKYYMAVAVACTLQ